MIWTRTGEVSGFNPAAAPYPGVGFAYATIGDKMYLIGGSTDGSPMLYVQEYDLNTNSWTTLADAPRSSSGLHAAAVVDGLLHYFDDTSGFTSYDPGTGTAVALTAPPAGGAPQATDLRVDGRNIYANVYSTSPWRYNVDDNLWYQDVAAHPDATGGDHYDYLSGFHDGLLYTHDVTTENQYRYDPVGDSWTEVYFGFLWAHRFGGNAVWTPDGYWYGINGSVSTGGSATNLAEIANPYDEDGHYALADPPDARIDFAIGALGDYIFMVGGTVSGVGEPDTYAGYRYARRDPAVWSEGLSVMPTAQRGTAYAAYNDELWVIGGLGTSTTAQSYNPATDTWTSRPTPSTPIDGDGASADVRGSLIYFTDWSTGFATYDPSDGTVTPVSPAEPNYSNLGGHDVSIANGILYALMGTSPNAVFDIAGGTWTTVAACPQNMGAANQAVLDGKIYVLSKGDPELYFYVYDPATPGWTALAPLPAYAYNTQIEATSVGTILALGSSDGPFGWEYDPVADSWTSIAHPPVERTDPAMAEAGGYLVLAGGEEAVWGSGGVSTAPADDTYAYQLPITEVQATLPADLSTVWPVDDTATLDVEFDSYPTLHVSLSTLWPAEALLPVTLSTARDGEADAGAVLPVRFTTIATKEATLAVRVHVASPDGTVESGVPYETMDAQALGSLGVETVAELTEAMGSGRVARFTRQGAVPTDATAFVVQQVAVGSGGTIRRYEVQRSILAPVVGPSWRTENGIPTWENASRNPAEPLEETIVGELAQVIEGGAASSASADMTLYGLDATLGAGIPSTEECKDREAFSEILNSRFDIAVAAAAAAGYTLTLIGSVPYQNEPPPGDYRTEGSTAAEVIGAMLFASNPRVWYVPGEILVDGRILAPVSKAAPSAPSAFLAAGGYAFDGASFQDAPASSEEEPLLADYLEDCERSDAESGTGDGTFETFETGAYSWVTRGGSGDDYQETTHELEKDGGRLVREAEQTEGYFEPFEGARYWGAINRTEVENAYHPVCPEALVARSEFTMQRKRRSDVSRFSGVEETVGTAPWSRSTEELLYAAIPTWYRQSTTDVEQVWHAEGWLRSRIETSRNLQGMVANPVRDIAGELTGYNVTLLYGRETREETYTPVGDGLWHIATTIRSTEQQPIYEPVNPDAEWGDEDYGEVELVGVQPVPVANAYTVVTDQAPPSVSCGDPCKEKGHDACVAEQTARWEEDHVNWTARQARGGERRVWQITANRLLPGAHLGEVRGGGIVTNVSHRRDFSEAFTTLEVTQWIA